MFKLEKIDRGIAQKTITHNDGVTITIEASMITPTKNNGLPMRRYGANDAARWLKEAGHNIGECLDGGRVYNYDYRDSSTGITKASWTFALVVEVEPEVKPKKTTRRTKAKATPAKETSVKSELPKEELSGLNFDGESESKPATKKTTSRRRRTTKR